MYLSASVMVILPSPSTSIAENTRSTKYLEGKEGRTPREVGRKERRKKGRKEEGKEGRRDGRREGKGEGRTVMKEGRKVMKEGRKVRRTRKLRECLS
jgi:hypothetical protein